MSIEQKKTPRFQPMVVGAVVESIGFATVLAGYFWRSGESWLLVAGIIGSTVIGSLTWFLLAKRLHMLFFGLVGGMAVGVISAWQLLLHEPFERQFFVAIATLAFYPAFGLICGFFAELVSFIHYLLHGRPARNYPDERPDDSPTADF